MSVWRDRPGGAPSIPRSVPLDLTSEYRVGHRAPALRHVARASRGLVVCIDNVRCSVSLERRKLYVTMPDAEAAKHGQLRVIDESGEDYLYPQEFFVAVELRGQAPR